MSGMSDHTEEELHDQALASMDILLHAKSKLSISNSFWDNKIFKKMQSGWSRAFLFTTQELDFSQPCGFHRFQKTTMVHHLKPKSHTDRPIFFSKSEL